MSKSVVLARAAFLRLLRRNGHMGISARARGVRPGSVAAKYGLYVTAWWCTGCLFGVTGSYKLVLLTHHGCAGWQEEQGALYRDSGWKLVSQMAGGCLYHMLCRIYSGELEIFGIKAVGYELQALLGAWRE